MEIVPAIDIIDGKCVRLIHGDYSKQTVYHSDPVDAAKAFEDNGFRRLHLVDLDGARGGAVVNWLVLERIASATKLLIDFSGGIRTAAQLARALDHGATEITVGSIAVKQPETVFEWLDQFGIDRFIISADTRDEKVAMDGWTMVSEISVADLIERYMREGVRRFMCTDIRRDGALLGPSIEMYRELKLCFPSLELIASGGVSSVEDLQALKSIGCSRAIVGKAIYEGLIPLEQIKTI